MPQPSPPAPPWPLPLQAQLSGVLAAAPLARWAAEDAAAASHFLAAQPAVVAQGLAPAQLESMGARGVLECFEVALEYLGQGEPLQGLAGEEGGAPRALQGACFTTTVVWGWWSPASTEPCSSLHIPPTRHSGSNAAATGRPAHSPA